MPIHLNETMQPVFSSTSPEKRKAKEKEPEKEQEDVQDRAGSSAGLGYDLGKTSSKYPDFPK